MTVPIQSPFNRRPFFWCSGLNISWLTATTLNISPGEISDVQNQNDLLSRNNIILDSSIIGAGGLDNGTLAEGLYKIYILNSVLPNLPSVIMSLSDSPVLPFGYGYYKRIGYVAVDSSLEFVKFWQVGDGMVRAYFYDTLPNVLTGGTATTFTNVSLTKVVPLVDNVKVTFKATLTPAVAGDAAYLLPVGGLATTPNGILGSVATVPQIAQLDCVAKVSGVDSVVTYKVTSGTDELDLDVLSYIDYL